MINVYKNKCDIFKILLVLFLMDDFCVCVFFLDVNNVILKEDLF